LVAWILGLSRFEWPHSRSADHRHRDAPPALFQRQISYRLIGRLEKVIQKPLSDFASGFAQFKEHDDTWLFVSALAQTAESSL
jgi:hypothetical protein